MVQVEHTQKKREEERCISRERALTKRKLDLNRWVWLLVVSLLSFDGCSRSGRGHSMKSEAALSLQWNISSSSSSFAFFFLFFPWWKVIGLIVISMCYMETGHCCCCCLLEESSVCPFIFIFSAALFFFFLLKGTRRVTTEKVFEAISGVLKSQSLRLNFGSPPLKAVCVYVARVKGGPPANF